jgi:hypothetical protein
MLSGVAGKENEKYFFNTPPWDFNLCADLNFLFYQRFDAYFRRKSHKFDFFAKIFSAQN